MWVTTVPDQSDAVILADPSRDRVAVTDFPVETRLGLAHDGGHTGVAVFDEFAYSIHIAGLEPRLLDVLGVLVRDDPVELFAVAERVLHQVLVLADPDVDALLFDEFRRQWVTP